MKTMLPLLTALLLAPQAELHAADPVTPYYSAEGNNNI